MYPVCVYDSTSRQFYVSRTTGLQITSFEVEI
jgi:hypothetical protein